MATALVVATTPTSGASAILFGAAAALAALIVAFSQLLPALRTWRNKEPPKPKSPLDPVEDVVSTLVAALTAEHLAHEQTRQELTRVRGLADECEDRERRRLRRRRDE